MKLVCWFLFPILSSQIPTSAWLYYCLPGYEAAILIMKLQFKTIKKKAQTKHMLSDFQYFFKFDILEGLIDLQVYWVIKAEVDRSSLFAVGSGFGPLVVLLSQMAVSNANCKNTCAGGDTCQEPMSGCIAPSFTCYTARFSFNNRNSQANSRGTANAHRTLKVSSRDTVKSHAILDIWW